MRSNGPILVVAAHPDDEAFGCGASLHRWQRGGGRLDARIQCLWLGEVGDVERMARTHVMDMDMAHRQPMLKQVGDHFFAGLRDQMFDAVPILLIAQLIEEVIRVVEPAVVLTHDNTDLNQDHLVVHQATLIATRPRQRRTVKALYTFEVPGSTEWGFSARFRPTTFVAVTEADVDAKIAAIRAYGELAEPPDPRSEPIIRAAAATWGSIVGVPLAEPLRLLWEIR